MTYLNLRKYLAPALVLGAASACQRGEKSAPEAAIPPPSVQVVQPRLDSLAEQVQVSGMLGGEDQLTLSFKTGGILTALPVEEGQRVRQGQLLARLNATELTAQVQQANEAYQKAQREVGRLRNLVRDTVATLEQLQNAQTALAVAQAQQATALFNAQLGELRAPAAGIVLQKNGSVGEFKTPGAPVVVLGRMGRDGAWRISAGLSDRDRVRLRVGYRATVTLDALPGQTFAGRVAELAAVPDAATNTYKLGVEFAPKGQQVVTGLAGKVTVALPASRAYTVVPLEALFGTQGSQSFVYTVGPDSTARAVPVTVAFLLGAHVALRTALSQPVITTGRQQVAAGQRITLAR